MRSWRRNSLAFTQYFSLLFTLGSALAFAQTNVNEEQGLKPYDSWHGGDLDSVSLTNGGLSLHIPLASFPQRGNLNLSFFLRFSSKGWQVNAKPSCYNPLPSNVHIFLEAGARYQRGAGRKQP